MVQITPGVHAASELKMSIRDYFKPSNGLPEPTGSLSLHVPAQAIVLLSKTLPWYILALELSSYAHLTPAFEAS